MALIGAGAPSEMVDRARRGEYDDFESDSTPPIADLVAHARAAGLESIARRAREGEFDATKEEAEAWAARQTDPAMVDLLSKLAQS